MKFEKGLLFGLSGLVLIGCGGSGGTGTGGSGSSSTPNTLSLGDAKASISGNAKPAVQDYESGLSISSISGASINTLTIDPTANLNNVPIYFVQKGTIYSYQRGAVQPAFEQSSQFVFDADISKDGHIYFSTVNGAPTYTISKANLDGTGLTTLATNALGAVRVSQDGLHVVYTGPGGLTVTSNYGTGTKVLDAAGDEGSISPDGTKVIYEKLVSGISQIFIIPIGGGTPTQITTDTSQHGWPTFNPDGTLFFCDVDSGSVREINSYLATGPDIGAPFAGNYFPNVPYASDVRFSPDGKYLSACVESTYNTGPTTVAIIDLSGNFYQTIATGSETIWPPFQVSRSFVGSGGAMYSSASGFIYSQFQPGFASLVAYTASGTATSTVVSTNSGNGTGPAVYDVHATTITGVKYANGYWQSPVAVASSASDVLLSIDTNTGLVTSVAPFDVTRGPSLVKTASSGGIVYKAHFAGVWNAKGKNIAPSGATQITLDPKHGTIVAVQ